MNAIPTMYKGIQFRSRLEAKWACFFDLVGWKWAYEPIDLAGYIPDFILEFQGSGSRIQLLAEVKGITAHNYDEADAFNRYAVKADEAGWKDDGIILGTSPLPFDGMRHCPRYVGEHFSRYHDSKDQLQIQTIGVHIGLCMCCKRYSLASVEQTADERIESHACVICECRPWEFRGVGGEHHLGHFLEVNETVDRMWAIASNQTQWRSPVTEAAP